MKTDTVLNPSPAKGLARQSNLELYRIILMLFIIAHHYVINSSVWAVLNEDPLSAPSLWLLELCSYGKTGINGFMLITGYFMCTSHITLRKYVKTLFACLFYSLVFFFIFVISGYTPFSVVQFAKIFMPIDGIASNFFGTYLMFFLFIPFLNILIQNISEKQHAWLVALTLFMYTILGTMPTVPVAMNYVSWYMVLYFIASYIRLYPKEIFGRTKLWGWLTVLSVAATVASVAVCTWIGVKLDRVFFDYFISDCNKILALTNGLFSFLFFKNLKVRQSKVINTVSGCVLGVLLIHTNGNVRPWLWEEVVRTKAMYGSPWMVGHVVLSCLLIFVICAAIEYLRIRFVEKQFLGFWDRHWGKTIKEKFGIS